MGETGTYHNKQSILNRMLDLAATIQKVNRSELLDPVVILFIESLAEEIYQLSAEVDNLEARVLNKLSSILISETETVARPAHSLLHISPQENKLDLTTLDSFIIDGQKKKQDILTLYPVCNTVVYKGGIRYFIFNRYLYSVDRELTKTLITRSGTIRKEQNETNSFWIGLELDHAITDIENLSFYINFSEGYNTADYLSQLLHGEWKCQGQDILVRKGLYSEDEFISNPKLSLFHRYNNSFKIDREIKEIYDKHYITIDQPLDISDRRENFPASLKPYFPENIQSGFRKEMLWLEITCSSDFTEDMMRAIEISINVIPVSCKQLVKEVLKINKYIPVIPLNTRDNESFLSVHSLSDSHGIQYYDIPLCNSEEANYGIYSLRRSNYERFGSNDAKEFLANMTGLLDQEAASFFEKNSESKSEQTALHNTINMMLRHLDEIVNSERKHTEIKNYLLVEQQQETEIYFLKYWITNSLIGEIIKENTLVRPSLGLQVNPAGIHLIKPLSGGKRTPSQYEKYSLYKKSLAEHPLLVTPDDIKKFCLKEFAEIVEQIEIRSGYKKSDKSTSDFIKTTDVYLHIYKNQQDKIEKNINQHIERVLQEHSPATFHYRVILK